MSNKQISLYQELHRKNSNFGASGSKYFPDICLVIEELQPKTILDYGCGKGVLIEQISKKYPTIKTYGYDPAIPGKDILPSAKIDLLINTDVLEHIPETELHNVLKQISSISENCYFALDHALAREILPTGENAHCLIKPVSWYERFLSQYFSSLTVLDSPQCWKSVILTFGVSGRFHQDYYRRIQPKTLFTKLKFYAYKVLSNVCSGKRREYYIDKMMKIGPF